MFSLEIILFVNALEFNLQVKNLEVKKVCNGIEKDIN